MFIAPALEDEPDDPEEPDGPDELGEGRWVGARTPVHAGCFVAAWALEFFTGLRVFLPVCLSVCFVVQRAPFLAAGERASEGPAMPRARTTERAGAAPRARRRNTGMPVDHRPCGTRPEPDIRPLTE
jgi:hypothetical protein